MNKSYDDPTNDGCFRVSLKGKHTPKYTPQDFIGKGKLFLNDKEIKGMEPFTPPKTNIDKPVGKEHRGSGKNLEDSKAFAKMMIEFQLKELSKNVSNVTRRKIEDLITPTKRDMYIPLEIPQDVLDYLKKKKQQECRKDMKENPALFPDGMLKFEKTMVPGIHSDMADKHFLIMDEASVVSEEAWKALKENKTLPSKLHITANPRGDRLSEFIHELPERECCKVHRITFPLFNYCPKCGRLLNRGIKND